MTTKDTSRMTPQEKDEELKRLYQLSISLATAADKDRKAAEKAKTHLPRPGLCFEGEPKAQAALATALAKAQGNFGHVGKDKMGQLGNQRFQYTTISAARKAVSGPLTDEGIALLMPISNGPDAPWVRVSCVLLGHGAQISTHLDLNPADWRDKNDRYPIQSFGKLTTYMRRYLLLSLLGLEGDKDADDEAEPVGPAEPPPPRTAGMTKEQELAIVEKAKELDMVGLKLSRAVSAITGKKAGKEMGQADAQKLIDWLGTIKGPEDVDWKLGLAEGAGGEDG